MVTSKLSRSIKRTLRGRRSVESDDDATHSPQGTRLPANPSRAHAWANDLALERAIGGNHASRARE